jgi:type II secretory pathway component PulC
MRHPLASIGLAVFCACGGPASRPPATGPTTTDVPPSKPAPAAARDPDRALTRVAVHAAVAQGLGAFLQHVELEDQPVVIAGKFHGFRIAAIHDASFWRGVDLRPGDVVTSVNGSPIERPEQAQAVFDSLDVASEIRVSYERDGQAREIVYAIVDGR